MKNSTHHYLTAPLLLILTCTYSLQSMEHKTPDTLAEEFARTIGTSSNSELGPLKDGLTVFSEQLEQMRKGSLDRQAKRQFDSGDDAGAAPALLVQHTHTSTPFNTPAKLKNSRRKQDRPTPVKTDTSVGLGSMSLSPFDNLSDNSPGIPLSNPLFNEQAQALTTSIANLEKLSTKLLENNNLLTKQEEKAVAYINAQSKEALYADERIIGGTALGLGAGALVWAARINPFRIYKECCSQNKFTGLELPALITAGKALIGPIVAIVAIGLAWRAFKQWIVEPYQEAHKSEVDRFKEELAKHKKEVAEALATTHQKSDETLKEVASTLALIKRTTNDQLEKTLKTVAEGEEDLKNKITDFIQKTKNFQTTITDNVHDLQESRDDLKATTETLLKQQEQILALVNKIKKDEEQLLHILKTKPLTSPASAPVGKAATPTSLVREPQSAHIQGSKSKKGWLGGFGRSSKVAPSPQAQPARALTTTPEDSPAGKPHLTINTSPEQTESKRRASRSNPTPETV